MIVIILVGRLVVAHGERARTFIFVAFAALRCAPLSLRDHAARSGGHAACKILSCCNAALHPLSLSLYTQIYANGGCMHSPSERLSDWMECCSRGHRQLPSRLPPPSSAVGPYVFPGPLAQVMPERGTHLFPFPAVVVVDRANGWACTGRSVPAQ